MARIICDNSDKIQLKVQSPNAFLMSDQSGTTVLTDISRAKDIEVRIPLCTPPIGQAHLILEGAEIESPPCKL
uniref:(California timema) hypothetical protein n=1 Tax=Timema californicum TaxID=61474 RepID=A0A7R9JBP6_TIMCA|nr:unnamed protein product [Timema californicum]